MRLLVMLALCTCGIVGVAQRKAIAVLYEDSEHTDATAAVKMVGVVEFLQESADKKLMVNINLFSNANFVDGLHGLHIHSLGNVYGGCSTTLGHYNPLAVAHGGPASDVRHVGDFGNIEIVNNAYTGEHVDGVASLYGQYSIIGRGVVLHAGQDDLGKGGDVGSTNTGNAGARLACGVIGVDSENFDSGGYTLDSSLTLLFVVTVVRLFLH